MLTAELPATANAIAETLEFSSLLEAAIAETESRREVAAQAAAIKRFFETAPAKPAPAAAAISAAPAKPAAVKPAPAKQAAPAPAKLDSKRRQKLATQQLAAGRYAFSYAGCSCEVTKGADGWKLTINGTAGQRRYETKRHAVNSARVFLDSRAADNRPAMKPAAAKPAPAPVAAPAKQAAPAPAPAAPQAGWRALAMTGKQAALLIRLREQLIAEDLSPESPLANKKGLTRGEASELIDSMKSQLGEPINSMRRRRYRRSAAGPQVDTCSIGPFNRGYCTCCGKRQA